MVGPMYEIWDDPNSEFKKHFYNWIWDDEYQIETNKTLKELEAEYKPLALEYGLVPDLVERFKINKGQLAFYISKVRRHKIKVIQEYPCTALEAFIASGRNVFSSAVINKHKPIPPIEKKWGDMLIWERPLKGFNYVVTADTSEGLGQDNAVLEVFNAYTGNQAAEFANAWVPPDELARYALNIAKWYNHALIIPEINGSGISFLDKIKNIYANIYKRETFDRRSNKLKRTLGWRTTATTKPKLIDDLEEAMRAKDVQINSKEAIKECKTFVRTTESGKQGFGAEGNKKDDRVIGCALAIQAFRYLPQFRPPKTIAQKKLDAYIEEKRLSRYFPGGREVLTGRNRPRYRLRK